MDGHIIHVSAYYPPHLGGQELAVQELVSQLALAGLRVEVVTSDLGGGSRGFAVESGVRVTRLRSSEVGHSAVIFGLCWWLIRHARRDSLVHLHFGQFFTSEIVWLASKLLRFEYIFHMHCDPGPSGPLGRLLPIYRRLFLGRELRDAAQVVVLNESHKRLVVRRYGRRQGVVVMRNGICSEFFRSGVSDRPCRDRGLVSDREPSDDGPLELVFVGRLSPPKNLDRLIKALGVAKTRVVLHIVGDGEARKSLEDLARAGHSGNVFFHGRLSRDEVARFYAKCGGFVLPSLFEAQPLSLLEAMASGLPAITTNVLGLSDMAGCTIMVDPSIEGLAEGIDRLGLMPATERADLTRRAFKRVMDHEWSRVLESYIQLYRAV